jgi:hypothetical protein
MHEFYTVDEQLKSHPNFKNIESTLDRLCTDDVVQRLPGNCISACDILQNVLSFYDINSKILECQAMAVKENKDTKNFCFVGFSDLAKKDGVVDSHVVIITQTEPPIIIDASIGHLLPQKNKILVKVLDNLDPDIIGKFEIEDVTITYHHKKNIRLPVIHQKNLVDRIQEHMNFDKKIKLVSKILMIIGSLTAVNFLFNMTLLGFEILKLLNR